MDVNTIVQLINGVGFPIFACIALGSFIFWDRKQRVQLQNHSLEKQEEMLKQVCETVTQNTEMIETLMKKMEE